MVDPDVVVRRLREIGRRLGELRALRAAADRSDPAAQAQVERHLQVAIQGAIDVALHVVADDTDRTPDDYGSAFVLLAEIGVIGPELAGRLRVATGLRNLLVHAYLDIDPDRLWAHLDHLDDLEAFASAVTRYLA